MAKRKNKAGVEMSKPKLYELTDEHRAQLKPWADLWIANAMRTGPYTGNEEMHARAALRGLYESAGLEAPPREIFVPSPMCGALACGIASGVWWLRENPKEHAKLFGRVLDESAIRAAMFVACSVADGRVDRLPPSTATRDATEDATRAATWSSTSAATEAATDDATSAATRAATEAATRDATWAATWAATRAATWAATRDATWAATWSATRAATDDATRAATRAATWAATSAATWAATRDATDDATRDATWSATWSATRDATSAATRDATSAATDDATRDATSAATDDATRDATSAATSAATWAATDDATRDATSAATRAATRAATWAATWAATSAGTALVARFLLQCASGYWSRFYDAGNGYSGWSSYVSFFRHVAKLNIDYSKWQHYESAAQVGPRFMHAKFWMVCSRPDVLKVDDQNRPHCATGPSHRWPDGRELFHWRGVKVPGEWITDAKNVDPMLCVTHPNMEQRRALTEIIGWSKVLEKLDAKTVDKHADPEIGELLEVRPMPGEGEDPFGRFLKVQCGTGRTFCLRVPPTCNTALEAQAVLFGVPESIIAGLEVRT